MPTHILKQSIPRGAPAPVILYANHIQLAGRETVRNGPVGSRMLLRCLEGEGPVVTGGRRIRLAAGDWLFLPWHHTIEYECRHCRSFFLEGIHLVPHLPPGAERPLLFQVPHTADAPLAAAPQRQDAVLPGLPAGLLQGRFEAGGRLDLFCRYGVAWYADTAARTEPAARRLAGQLLTELAQALAAPAAAPMPVSLERVTRQVRDHLDHAFSVPALARLAACSPATLTRLFHHHLGFSPAAWIMRTRIAHAAVLLATTDLPVADIGRRCGIPNPFYFSRLFHRLQGITPRHYRHRHPVL